MQLSTVVPINKNNRPIDYDSKAVLLGSCFTENIGQHLKDNGFHTVINPFGIIFNPHSIYKLVDRAVQQRKYMPEEVEETYCYEAHSRIHGSSKEDVIDQLNTAVTELYEALSSASHIYITLGTAWTYRHIEKDMLVANCHKQPASFFKKELLSINQMDADLNHLLRAIRSINPAVQLTYTLSPVRHLKDGFSENQRSKSRLYEVIQRQVEQNETSYFPAYEIAMDELRDYRFYARDMVHVNDLGIDYIWSRFRESELHNNTITTQKAVQKYRKLCQHRPTDPIAHQQQIAEVKTQLLQAFPKVTL